MEAYHKSLMSIVLVVALFTVGCTFCPLCSVLGPGDGSGDGPGSNKHYEDDRFSFDYPGDWRTLSEIWGHEVPTGVADPGTGTPWEKYLTWVNFEEQPLLSGSTLEEVLEQADPFAVGEISQSTITVDGLTAYERVYEAFVGEPLRKTREVWLEKGGTVYVITCWSTPGHFDEAQADFDVIIDSFHVK